MEDNGWYAAKALVMDKLETIATDVKDLQQHIERKYLAIEKKLDRYHVAPCSDITTVREDSAKLKQRMVAIEKRMEEDRAEARSRYLWAIRTGLAIVGLLVGILGTLLKSMLAGG